MTYGSDLTIRHYENLPELIMYDFDDDVQEVQSRLILDEHWDEIDADFRLRILAVDRVVYDEYRDYFDYDIWKEFIAVIRRRLAEAGMLGDPDE